ncbi:hypothetical protein IEQ34_007507 [Dendrobium chrysotoxum]|uniref:Uncharacterized protein n=1 Tax=Dendrobium chrysotoxum TaxID=161865 RepID=A0AAV7H412_DENCH|nr:hypothetical protein IEQ34_007507 [Dendrobium chrysotoxum]
MYPSFDHRFFHCRSSSLTFRTLCSDLQSLAVNLPTSRSIKANSPTHITCPRLEPKASSLVAKAPNQQTKV